MDVPKKILKIRSNESLNDFSRNATATGDRELAVDE
jgi:hypothetical protein